jgi:SAM-dependent methyltransferase
MTGDPVAMTEILRSCEAGRISPAVAMMQLLIETEDAHIVSCFIREQPATHVRSALIGLLDAKRAGIARVAEMLRSDMDRPPENGTIEEGIAFCRRLFDWSVEQSEEASVALYSLGDPALLNAATDEIVTWLATSGLLGVGRDALDSGCGAGRLTRALAPRLRTVIGIDVSPRMVERAQSNCRDLSNVDVKVGSGRGLEGVSDASVDLVLAVDVFPYLVQSGIELAETHIHESARVLRTGGDFALLNFSYRGDVERDASDVARMAHGAGFDVRVRATRPFQTWDGLAFRLRKR